MMYSMCGTDVGVHHLADNTSHTAGEHQGSSESDWNYLVLLVVKTL